MDLRRNCSKGVGLWGGKQGAGVQEKAPSGEVKGGRACYLAWQGTSRQTEQAAPLEGRVSSHAALPCLLSLGMPSLSRETEQRWGWRGEGQHCPHKAKPVLSMLQVRMGLGEAG